MRHRGSGCAKDGAGRSASGKTAPAGPGGCQPRDAERRRLRAIVEQSHDVVIVTDPQCEIVWVNRNFTATTGWTLEEVKGCNPRSFLHGPRTDPIEAARLDRLLRTDRSVTAFELINYKKSGETYWVSLSVHPVIDRHGELIEFVAIQTDITERKRRDADLQRALHRLSQAYQLAGLAWMEHELATGRVVCSPELARYFGLDERKAANLHITDLMPFTHPDDAERVRAEYAQAINSGVDYVSEHRVLRPDGEVRWIRMRGVLEGWEDGRAAVVRIAAKDETEHREAENVSREHAALERAARSQTEVLAQLSELQRAPLRVVLGLAEIVERTEARGLSARGLAYVRRIQAAADELRQIVEGVSELASLRRDAGFDAVAVDLHALAGEAAAAHEASAELHRVTIHVAPASKRAIVVGDARRLRQLLALLIGDAIEHSRAGGQIQLKVEAAESASVRLEVRDPDRTVDAQTLARLFEPFGCAMPADAAARGGGVRLALCKALVEGMGGAIRAESTPDARLVLVAWLPAAGETVVPIGRVATTGVGKRQAGACRLLCIDEDIVGNVLVEGLLARRSGLALRFEQSGAEGLAAARAMKPDLIFVALQLPDMSGSECLEQIRSEAGLRGVPCVAMSADSHDQAVVAAIRAGFGDFLPKPARLDDLLRLIDRFTGV